MLVSQKVIDGMEAKGFYMAEGAAVINDVVVVELRHPFRSTRAMTLKTQESVNVFNNEVSPGAWAVFRKYDN